MNGVLRTAVIHWSAANKHRAPLYLSRCLVSAAFKCEDEWAKRLDHKVFNVRNSMGEFFVELDRKFTNEMRGSAFDVDVFANAARTETDLEQLEELLHKLRRTPHTIHSSASTNHALIRAVVKADSDEHFWHLVKMLEDRINYGVFLDSYTNVLLLDALVEKKKIVQGARVASQLMLQEESEPISITLGNLCCWRYVSDPDASWFQAGEDHSHDEVDVEEDPDDIIRVRVREGPPHFGMVPNGYFDDHFDLRKPNEIIGKTLWYFNQSQTDKVAESLNFLGLILWGKKDKALLETPSTILREVYDAVVRLCSKDEDIIKVVEELEKVDMDVDSELVKKCTKVLSSNEATLVDEQKKLYANWAQERDIRVKEEFGKLEKRKKLEFISTIKEDLNKEEEKLFFFDNKDKLDEAKENKLVDWKKTFPRRTWPGTKGNFSRPQYIRVPGQDLKTPRWQKREEKRGPPK